MLLCCWSNEGVGALDTSRPNLSGVADDDREEGHCKVEVLAGLSLVFSPQRFIELSSPSTPSRMWPGVKSSRLSQQNSFKIKRTLKWANLIQIKGILDHDILVTNLGITFLRIHNLCSRFYLVKNVSNLLGHQYMQSLPTYYLLKVWY